MARKFEETTEVLKQNNYEKNRRYYMLKYPRKMHGGELWAKIEVLENVVTPLLKVKLN